MKTIKVIEAPVQKKVTKVEKESKSLKKEAKSTDMIFGKTENHNIVFPKVDKKLKLDQVDAAPAVPASTNKTAPLTIK